MRAVPLLEVAPLTADRVRSFEGARPYWATGDVGDQVGGQTAQVTYIERPSRADLTVQPGDVCFARMAATKKVFEFTADHRDLILSTGFAVLRPDANKVHSGYIRRWLSTDQFQLSKDRLSSGATQIAITNAKMALLTIPLPATVDEQIRITEILDRGEALRDRRRAALAKLEVLTQSVFFDMFGDPVSNPRKWPQETLSTFFNIKTGKLDSNAAVSSGQYPFFTCAREDSRIDSYAFDCEALLLAGNNANADYSVKLYKGKFNAYQRTYVITLRNQQNSYAYSRFVLEHRLGELKRISKGSGTKYLTLELLNKISIPVPPPELQEQFSRRVGAIETLKVSHLSSYAESTALCASLEHRAFRGEL